jgi:tRNA pseudouridine38-40 synthase
MRNLKLTVRYDGTEFSGWQTQPGFRTVQETLEAAIAAITREERVRVNCSGRTDSGVHAYGQVVNFFTSTALTGPQLVKAINSQLPADVCVRDCEEMPQAFDANRDAIAKRYRYVIDDGRIPDPFLRRYAWQPRRNLNVDAMHRSAQVLRGRHDFHSFETDWPNRLTSIRTIADIIAVRSETAIHVEVEADGFLYNMVRAIVGTLYNVGRGYWSEDRVREILEGQDRQLAGPTAPAQGLFMLWVRYAKASERITISPG